MKRKIFTLIAVALITIQLSTPVFASTSNGDFNETSLNENEENTSEDYFEDEIVEHKDTGKYGSLPPASVQVQIDNGTITLNNRLTRGATGIWQLQSNGKWKFLFTVSANGNIAGTYATNQWNSIDNKWYHFDSSSYMQEGWFLDTDGKWYYLQPKDGAMRIGWVEYGKRWYYLNAAGAMQTGWISLNSKVYYLWPDGGMCTGWLLLNNQWYYFPANGARTTGWVNIGYPDINIDKYWNYFNSGGVLTTDSDVKGSTSGHNTFADHTILKGITSLTYKTSGATSFNKQITSEANSWNSTASGINLSITSGEADIMFTASNYGSNGVLAATYFYNSKNQKVEPSQNNWTKTTIQINTASSNNGFITSTTNPGTIAHEIGHAVGLSHKIMDKNSIMCQVGKGRTVSTPQTTDVNVVKYLYKKGN